MTEDEIENGRKYHDALAEVFVKSARGAVGYHSILEVRRLCRAAFIAVDDNYCREQLDLIELYAADFFSEAGSKGWRRGALSGSDVLKDKISKCLGTFEARLIALDSARQSATASQRASGKA